jgi:hypothetical protein
MDTLRVRIQLGVVLKVAIPVSLTPADLVHDVILTEFLLVIVQKVQWEIPTYLVIVAIYLPLFCVSQAHVA